MKSKFIILFILIFVVFLFGCVAQVNNGLAEKPSAPINQNFDFDNKLPLVGDIFDITLTISAREEYLNENVIVSLLYDKIHSQYESPFDGDILNFEDNFEIVSISNGWKRQKITEQSNYEIVKLMAQDSDQSEILEKGWLYIHDGPSTETKTLMLSLKAKQKGRFGLVMSQMQSKTGFVNICVGDTIEEAQEFCKERVPTSTRAESTETN